MNFKIGERSLVKKRISRPNPDLDFTNLEQVTRSP
jgi:hypothetical protein